MQIVSDIRNTLANDFKNGKFVTDKSGQQVIEIIGATFLADQDSVFGEVNHEYVQRELEWYQSMSRFVDDIPGGPPAIWKQVASRDGMINSNYGYLIWSDENHNQYDHVLEELKKNPDSRRAEMIYTRPSIWKEYNLRGMSDFLCTDSAQYFIRSGKLIAHVRMRSNDAVFGYRNDVHWQRHVHEMLAKDLDVPTGDMIWTAGSFHLYSRHFYMVDHFIKTGETSTTKSTQWEVK